MKKSLLLCFLFSSSIAMAQNKIEGTIKNKSDGEILEGVSVFVKEANAAKILAFGISDSKGAYKLSYQSSADSIVVSVSSLNFKKQTLISANKTQQIDFQLEAAINLLKEVKVKPPRMHKLGDTINYLVNGYLDQNDRTIGDVLKKIPGINVKSDGSISYNNRPINKFYIEDQDLLQGRYGIATNNIEAKDVKSVQVLENHQPIKALKDKEFTDQAALNLKLTNSAKNVLIANAQTGIGIAPLLWDNEAFGMHFKKGRQIITTYKGNNTGNNSASSLKNFYAGDSNMGYPISLSVQTPSSPGINNSRFLLNRDNAISVNNLWAIRKDYQLIANVSFQNDKWETDSYSRSSFYLRSDSVLTIEEKLNANERLNQLNSLLQLNLNKDKVYVDNAIKFYGKVNSQQGSVLNRDSVFQDWDKPFVKLSNTFNLIRNYKKVVFKFSSYNGYSRNPQTLDIQPLVYESLFGSAGLLSMRQTLFQDYFASHTNMNFGINKGRWRQDYSLGFDANRQRLESALDAKALDGLEVKGADSLRNNLVWIDDYFHLNSKYSYTTDEFKAILELPLKYMLRDINEQYPLTSQKINKLFFLPSMFLQYKLNLFWTFSTRAGYSESIGGIENNYRGYIMNSYRNFGKNSGQLPKYQNKSLGFNLQYSNPITAIHANLRSDHFKNKADILYGSRYTGILSTQTVLNSPNISEGYSVSGSIDKGFDGMFRRIRIDADYGAAKHVELIQDAIVNYTSDNYQISSNLSLKFKEWAIFSYDFQYSNSLNKTASGIYNSIKINNVNQMVNLNVFPSKDIVINMIYNYRYNSAINGTDRTMDFADAVLKYRIKKADIAFEFNNIFNRKQFISISNNPIRSYYALYELRPMQILLKVRFKLK